MASLQGNRVQWIDPISGKRKTRTFGDELRARRFCDDKRDEAALLRAGRLSRKQIIDNSALRTPIGDVIEEYRKKLAKRNTVGRDHKKQLEVLAMVIRECAIHTVEDVEKRKLETYLQGVAGRVSGRTHNFHRKAIFGLCRYMRDFGYVTEDLTAGIESQPEQVDKPSRPLAVSECEALMAACPSAYRRLCHLFRIRTGLRATECGRLRWGDLQLGRAVVYLRGSVTKNGKQEPHPLTADVVAALAEYRAGMAARGRELGEADLVFPTSMTLHSWRRDLKLAEISSKAPLSEDDPTIGRADLKCLRNTFESHLQRSGVNLLTVALLMRHSLPAGLKLTAGRYADKGALLAEKRQGVDCLERWYRREAEALRQETERCTSAAI